MSDQSNNNDKNTRHSMGKSIVKDVNDIFVMESFPPSGDKRRKSSDSPCFMHETNNNQLTTQSSSSKSTVHMNLTRGRSLTRDDIKRLSGTEKSTSEDTELDKSSSGFKWSRQDIFTIACLALGNLCLGTLYALLAPFFPHEVRLFHFLC